VVASHVETTAILGGGSWGTALAIHLARLGRSSRLWFRDPQQARRTERSRINTKYLPQWTIPEEVELLSDLGKALRGATAAVVVVPSRSLWDVARDIRENGPAHDILWISATKGIVGEEGRRPSEILREALGLDQVAVLAGPSLSEEVLRGLPTAVVAASETEAPAVRTQNLFHGPRFRVYTASDVIGVELGVSLKNVLAIAAGLAQELGLGHNGYGALLTRGLAEICRLGVKLGARRETFLGLAGLGDLVTTCGSPLSRNHQVGRRLARGEALEDILDALGCVAEGVPTVSAALALAGRAGVEMPITAKVYEILFRGKDPRQALEELMLRPPGDEDGSSRSGW
jgi:glycerol-3-phosphate dehydrogenase (NAD(P)+)